MNREEFLRTYRLSAFRLAFNLSAMPLRGGKGVAFYRIAYLGSFPPCASAALENGLSHVGRVRLNSFGRKKRYLARPRLILRLGDWGVFRID